MRLVFKKPLPTLQADVMQKWDRTKYRKEWHKRVWLAVRESGEKPREPWKTAGIVVVRHSALPEPDRDNLAYSAKVILDGLVKAGVIADDAPANLEIQRYTWEHATGADQRVEVEVSDQIFDWRWGRDLCPHCGCTD